MNLYSLSDFDPDATGVANGNYFGFPFNESQAALSLISVPWDVTVSYRAGSAAGPRAIIEASTQVEIFDADYAPDLWRGGIVSLPIDKNIEELGVCSRECAERVIAHIEQGGSESDAVVSADVRVVNLACRAMVDAVRSQALGQLSGGRVVGLVGGDHSTPLGLIEALAVHHPSFGILHIDAHADLRQAYEGFEYSHASIMYNALKIKQVTRLTQVAVRDFSFAEASLAASDERVIQFTDRQMSIDEFNGILWGEQCRRIVDTLPSEVYVSFDIDGLDRSLCPSTGTPVPGGLSWAKAVNLLIALRDSGRRVIGFDLNEVSPSADDEWDAIVGARLLYKLSLLVLSGVSVRGVRGVTK
ncbi:MAG: agmatinase family protein [Mucinivorans sp.]